MGTNALISAQERSTVSSGLRQAAFWVGLRQEIYISFVNQRSVQSNLDRCNIDRSLDPTDDCTWANRIIVHCADVLTFCFRDHDHTVRRWTELKGYNEQWVKAVPPSFSPIYYQDPEREKGEIFPQIWHIGDSHGKSDCLPTLSTHCYPSEPTWTHCYGSHRNPTFHPLHDPPSRLQPQPPTPRPRPKSSLTKRRR